MKIPGNSLDVPRSGAREIDNIPERQALLRSLAVKRYLGYRYIGKYRNLWDVPRSGAGKIDNIPEIPNTLWMTNIRCESPGEYLGYRLGITQGPKNDKRSSIFPALCQPSESIWNLWDVVSAIENYWEKIQRPRLYWDVGETSEQRRVDL